MKERKRCKNQNVQNSDFITTKLLPLVIGYRCGTFFVVTFPTRITDNLMNVFNSVNFLIYHLNVAFCTISTPFLVSIAQYENDTWPKD